ncbi:ANTAR domain-containing protein [Cellulomonas xylanilytica]|uniref:Transcriptional regulator n=1 Tax=Cellulomonas xylanilytica TaxID=233583 RepID=A0A510VE27_9CELL|nr:ANTAR domain-containing protein [Cellulomonas xylanilytica]GEK23450.1 transcriptional regulator [Cellulomonas xylanilytica]
MTDHQPVEALGHLLAALVREHETGDVLAEIVHECASLLPADAAALLVDNGGHGLEPLSATSHRASELEVYQAQQDTGPCVDAVRTGETVVAVGAAEIIARWPDVGRAIVDAGFASVHAFPMSWHGHTLGGLNVFSEQAVLLAESSLLLGQNLADVATLTLAQPQLLREDELAGRIRSALEGRVAIEQAKGVIAEREGVDMATAYDRLLQRVLDTGSTLGATARRVVGEAHER